MIADMEVRASTARLAYYRAAEKMLRGEPFKREASIAKLYSSEVAMENARYATQVHGGYGFMNEFPVGRFYRDAKILEIGEGTSEVQRMLIARDLGVWADGSEWASRGPSTSPRIALRPQAVRMPGRLPDGCRRPTRTHGAVRRPSPPARAGVAPRAPHGAASTRVLRPFRGRGPGEPV